MCPKTKQARIHWKKKVGDLLRLHKLAVVVYKWVGYNEMARDNLSHHRSSSALQEDWMSDQGQRQNKRENIQIHEAHADTSCF